MAGRTDPRHTLRLPQALMDRIETAARQSKRSKSAEMAHLLEAGLESRSTDPAPATASGADTPQKPVQRASGTPTPESRSKEQRVAKAKDVLAKFPKPTYRCHCKGKKWDHPGLCPKCNWKAR